MKNKHAKRVTRKSSGPRHAPEAKNTAPKVVPEKGIAGFSRLKAARSTGPTIGSAPGGYNPPRDGTKCRRKSGGPSRSGPSYTQGGTSSPRHGRGPSGLGLSGSKFAPMG